MRRTFVFFSLLVTAACASTAGPVQPLPFPGATHPPPATTTTQPWSATPPPIADAVVRTAMEYRGVHYVLGGVDPSTGFDCSGLVQYVFQKNAVTMPRTVTDQFHMGLPVKLQDLRAGDLVFFSTTGPGPTHVGIALDHDQFIHAPNSNGVVRIEHVDTSYWHPRFVGARRLF
jgi:cell wall-associated NlpC family hydrolase